MSKRGKRSEKISESESASEKSESSSQSSSEGSRTDKWKNEFTSSSEHESEEKSENSEESEENNNFSDLVEYPFSKTPKTDTWAFNRLIKETIDNKILVWMVGFDGKELIFYHGRLNGKIIVDTKEVELNQSGKNIQEQALQQARHAYMIKYRNGYHPIGEAAAYNFKAMKGVPYTESSRLNFPVAICHKMDGMRATFREGKLWTYTNKNVYFQEKLEKEIQKFLVYLPYGSVPDGELYIHGVEFTKLMSIIKRIKNKHKDANKIEYHVFDIDYHDTKGATFERRYRMLKQGYEKFYEDMGGKTRIKLVPIHIVTCRKAIRKYHKRFISEGYEGTVIRKRANGADPDSAQYKSSLYVYARRANMLKYKDTQDAEGKIVGVYEGTGKHKGAIMFKVKAENGQTFGVTLMGSLEKRRELWLNNPKKVIGKYITYKYDSLSPDGIPRFAVGKSLRDKDEETGEYE